MLTLIHALLACDGPLCTCMCMCVLAVVAWTNSTKWPTRNRDTHADMQYSKCLLFQTTPVVLENKSNSTNTNKWSNIESHLRSVSRLSTSRVLAQSGWHTVQMNEQQKLHISCDQSTISCGEPFPTDTRPPMLRVIHALLACDGPLCTCICMCVLKVVAWANSTKWPTINRYTNAVFKKPACPIYPVLLVDRSHSTGKNKIEP